MAADIIKHPPIAFLTGSSAPTGAPPSFEPLASAEAGPSSDPIPDAVASPPDDPVFDLIETHRSARAAWELAMKGRDSDRTEPVSTAEDDALEELLCAEPTTVPGLKTWVEYVSALVVRDGDSFAALKVLPNIAEATDRLLWSTPLRARPGYDAELVTLGQEYDKLLPLLNEAYRERYRLEALRDNSLPDFPAGLRVDPANRFSEDIEFYTVPRGEDRFYTAKAIERLRKYPRTKMDFDQSIAPGDGVDRVMKRVPDAEAQARVPAIIAVFEEWDAACRRHSAEIGYDAAARHHEDLVEQVQDTFDQIEAIVPVSLRGLAVQATTMLLHPKANLLKHLVVDRLKDFANSVESRAMSCSTRQLPLHNDAILIALGKQAEAFEATLVRLRRAYSDSEGDDDPRALAYEAGADQQHEVLSRIAAEPAQTFQGFLVKARALAYIHHEGLSKTELGLANEMTDSALIWSILSDLCGIARKDETGTEAADVSDPIKSLHAEAMSIKAIFDGAGPTADVAASSMERLSTIDHEVIASEPITIEGAYRAIRWALDEMHIHDFEIDGESQGDKFIRSLLEGAARFLKRSVSPVETSTNEVSDRNALKAYRSCQFNVVGKVA